MIWRLFVIFADMYGFQVKKQLFYKKRRMNSVKKRVIS